MSRRNRPKRTAHPRRAGGRRSRRRTARALPAGHAEIARLIEEVDGRLTGTLDTVEHLRESLARLREGVRREALVEFVARLTTGDGGSILDNLLDLQQEIRSEDPAIERARRAMGTLAVKLHEWFGVKPIVPDRQRDYSFRELKPTEIEVVGRVGPVEPTARFRPMTRGWRIGETVVTRARVERVHDSTAPPTQDSLRSTT